jgi:uncharacterized membrane protein YvbJ
MNSMLQLFCENCGNKYTNDAARFCSSCGNKRGNFGDGYNDAPHGNMRQYFKKTRTENKKIKLILKNMCVLKIMNRLRV